MSLNRISDMGFRYKLSRDFNMATDLSTMNSTMLNSTQMMSPHSFDMVLRTTLSTIICVGGFIGNVTIAAIILRRKKLQTATNWFVFNLAICDLSIILFTIPFTLVNPFIRWPFGYIGCRYLIMPVMEHFAGVCVLTHTAVGLSRYMIINNAGAGRRVVGNMAVRFTICLIWITSFLVLSATLMGFLGVFEINSSYKCELRWISPVRKKLYRVCVFVLTYVVPMIVTGYSYYRIHKIVATSLHNINGLLSQEVLASRQRKTRRMDTILMTMYVTFAIATLPLQTFMFLHDFNLIERYQHEKLTFYLLMKFFYAQVVTTPFVLFYMGEEYRKEIYRLPICCCLSLPRMRELSLIVRGSIREVKGQYTKRKISRYNRPTESSSNSSRRQLIEEKNTSSSNSVLTANDDKWISNASSLNKMNHLNDDKINHLNGDKMIHLHGDKMEDLRGDKLSHLNGDKINHLNGGKERHLNETNGQMGNIYGRFDTPAVGQNALREQKKEELSSDLEVQRVYVDSKSTDSIERITSRTLSASLERSDLSLNRAITQSRDHTDRTNINQSNSSNNQFGQATYPTSSHAPELLLNAWSGNEVLLGACNVVPNVRAYYDDGTIMYFYDPVIGRVSLAHDSGRETAI